MDKHISDGMSPPIGDISAIISKIKENPEIVSAVASAISGGSNKAEDTAPQQSQLNSDRLPDIMSTLKPLLQGNSHSDGETEIFNREECRCALLRALRPYLSRERREVVDQILKFGKLGELIKNLK